MSWICFCEIVINGLNIIGFFFNPIYSSEMVFWEGVPRASQIAKSPLLKWGVINLLSKSPKL